MQCRLVMSSLAVVGNLVPRQGVVQKVKNACRTRAESLVILLTFSAILVELLDI